MIPCATITTSNSNNDAPSTSPTTTATIFTATAPSRHSGVVAPPPPSFEQFLHSSQMFSLIREHFPLSPPLEESREMQRVVTSAQEELIAGDCIVTSACFHCQLSSASRKNLDLRALQATFNAQKPEPFIVDAISFADGANFLMIKGVLFGMNLTIKIYNQGYVQVFGLSGIDFTTAQAHVETLVSEYVVATVSKETGTELSVSSLAAMSVAANHSGVSSYTHEPIGFDIGAIEAIYNSASRQFPDNIKISRHSRHHGLIVGFTSSSSKKLGSCIFHKTGTVQLMGVDSALVAAIPSQLQDMIHAFPSSLCRATSKRRIRVQPSVARKKRDQALLQKEPAKKKKRSIAEHSNIRTPKKRRSIEERLDEALVLGGGNTSPVVVGRRDSSSTFPSVTAMDIEEDILFQAEEFYAVAEQVHMQPQQQEEAADDSDDEFGCDAIYMQYDDAPALLESYDWSERA